jgi:ATP-dependent helicase/nuclease subunit B
LPGGGLAIVDYKTGQPPRLNVVEAGFALQLGLLGMIADAGGFPNVAGKPCAFEYWSLAKDGGAFGKRVRADKNLGPDEFLMHARRNFEQAARDWLIGDRAFTAKLNPAYAPYGDYNHLMRLEEWYGRK